MENDPQWNGCKNYDGEENAAEEKRKKRMKISRLGAKR